MKTPATVYVVDDDISVRRALRRMLGAAGYHVVICETPEAFLELTPFATPACLLLDVRMPRMTGLELQTTLCDEGRHPPIVMLSGHADATMTERAMSAGAVAVLSKPIEFDVLVRAVERGLARDRLN